MEDESASATRSASPCPAARLAEALERASHAVVDGHRSRALIHAARVLVSDAEQVSDCLVSALDALLGEHLDARRDNLARNAELVRVGDLLHAAEARLQDAYRRDRNRFERLSERLRIPTPESWGEAEWTDLLDRVVVPDDGCVLHGGASDRRTAWERLGEG